MTPQPERRKSQLAGRSPLAPKTDALPSNEQDEGTGVATPQAPRGSSTTRPKMGYFADNEDEAGRIRAAWQHTLTTENGRRSLAQFQHDAVLAFVEMLEHRYNDGDPWPYLPSGTIRTGRPVGS